MEVFKLPAKKMLVLLKEVVSHSPIGDRLLTELANAVKENMEQFGRDNVNYEYNESLGRFNDDLDDVADQTDDDGLRDFLGNLGIGLSDEEDDEDEY